MSKEHVSSIRTETYRRRVRQSRTWLESVPTRTFPADPSGARLTAYKKHASALFRPFVFVTEAPIVEVAASVEVSGGNAMPGEKRRQREEEILGNFPSYARTIRVRRGESRRGRGSPSPSPPASDGINRDFSSVTI